MGRAKRLHKQRVIAGIEAPFVHQNSVLVEQKLNCHKCNTEVLDTKAEVTAHLKLCQPLGATCDKCGELFTPDDFFSHYRSCNGYGVRDGYKKLAMEKLSE